MADGPTTPAATVTPAKPAAPSWPKDFDPKKQGKGYAIAHAPAVWALLHGSDPASGMKVIGFAPFDTGTPEQTTAYGAAGAYMKHFGADDECPRCGVRVSQITRNNGPVCVGCGGVRIMGEEN